jgi:hypothetical protein
MDIKGLDYNTQREKLVMPEYGREIQEMVDHAVSLPDRSERLRCAKTIIRLMESKNATLRESSDFEQTLWDHLYLMSHKQLDIDWPFDVSNAEKIQTRPQPMAHPQSNGKAHLRHYGRLITEMFEKLKQMPAGPERDELVRLTANQMKRDLLTWGHGSIDDEKVADDLARFTDGIIQLDLGTFRFERMGGMSAANDGNGNGGGKRKRKK